MNFRNIKSVKNSLLVLMALLFATACEDEEKAPIVTFDSAGKGAYVKFVDQSGSTLLNLLTEADFDASSYTYSVEFVDGELGARVTSYDLEIGYNNNDPVALRSYGASDFSAQPSVRGGLGVTDVNITSSDVTSALGLSYTDFSAGDEVFITGTITTENGTYGGSNSSASVAGGAFQGFFDITMPAACPSDLGGTFSYATASAFCNGAALTGTVDIVALGGGAYTFSDNSFGTYQECYGAGMTGGIQFTEVCEVVSFTGFVSQYGETWSFIHSISGNDWIIDATNESFSPEFYVTTVTFPDGVPFTVN